MVVKAVLFLLLALLCIVGLWLRSPGLYTAVLALVLAWSAARLYYFLFYVLHAYVDPRLKYTGLLSLLRARSSLPLPDPEDPQGRPSPHLGGARDFGES